MTLSSFMDVYYGSFTFDIFTTYRDQPSFSFFKSTYKEYIVKSEIYRQIAGLDIGGISLDPCMELILICLLPGKDSENLIMKLAEEWNDRFSISDEAEELLSTCTSVESVV